MSRFLCLWDRFTNKFLIFCCEVLLIGCSSWALLFSAHDTLWLLQFVHTLCIWSAIRLELFYDSPITETWRYDEYFWCCWIHSWMIYYAWEIKFAVLFCPQLEHFGCVSLRALSSTRIFHWPFAWIMFGFSTCYAAKKTLPLKLNRINWNIFAIFDKSHCFDSKFFCSEDFLLRGWRFVAQSFQ